MGLYPSLLSYCQLVDPEEGDFIVFGGIPVGEYTSQSSLDSSKPQVTQTVG